MKQYITNILINKWEKVNKYGKIGQNGSKRSKMSKRRKSRPEQPMPRAVLFIRAELRAQYCSSAPSCVRGTVHARAQCPSSPPPRAQRVFAPFSTCSRPHDVMLTSSMTSQCPLRVFTFFNIFLNIFFNIFLLIFSLHPHL